MDNPFQIAFIGIVAVFLVLSLVILSGYILIKISNYFAPENTIQQPITKVTKPSDSISPKKMAAIIAVVEKITKGKGNVEKIKRI